MAHGSNPSGMATFKKDTFKEYQITFERATAICKEKTYERKDGNVYTKCTTTCIRF